MTVQPEGQPTAFALMTGPVSGLMTTRDGTKYDVTPAVIYVQSQEHADDLADQIGKHWAKVGHPDDVEQDPETGELVQRAFVYDTPEQARHKLRAAGVSLEGDDD